MAATSGAIAERFPLADLILEVRDARVPLSSEYELLKNYPSPPRRIVVLDKMDLANSSHTKFLNFLQAKVRELKRMDNSSSTAAIRLVGIPNAGKSTLANS